jgi:hypothetical protein
MRRFLDNKRVFASVVSLALLGAFALAAPAAASVGGFAPITATGHRIQNDVGSCNNDWASVSLDKAYKLTTTKAGGYNLEVKEAGPLTTIAGISPGACESGANNGNTVAAGITGKTHQEFNAPVTATTAPNPNPDCVANNGCAGSGDFLNAVFGAGSWSRGGFSWTAHYEAGSNGTYFDTSVNWPLNNRGDITGS